MHRFIFIIMVFTMIAGFVRAQNREVYNRDESESISLTYEFKDVVSQMLDTNEVFNMYRVSDIEQLIFQRNDGYTNIDKAVVFGGLSFKTGIKELSDSTTVLSFRDRFTFLSLYLNGVAKLGSVTLKQNDISGFHQTHVILLHNHQYPLSHLRNSHQS